MVEFKKALLRWRKKCGIMNHKKLFEMKTLMIITAVIVAGCSGNDSKSIQSFIPGIYVRQYAGEYVKGGEDTLVINETNGSADVYTIVRHVSYQRLIEGKVQTREYKTENWTGIYDEKTKALHEQKYGSTISFDPEKKILMVGSDEYQKIK